MPGRIQWCRGLDSHRLYGIGIEFPDAIGNGLPRSRGAALLRVLVSSRELWNSGENGIQWFHSWYTREGSCWLSAGQRDDGWYLLHSQETDFVVAPGGEQIYFHTSAGHPVEVSRQFLLNQVIPMVMNLRGTEVIHASSVLTSQGAIVFVGNGGYGKSTLAASLIREQSPLLSDDAVPLVVRGQQAWTSSGPPEMGLWPRARRLLNRNDDSPNKLLVPLRACEHQEGEFPLARIYFLQPSDRVRNVAVKPASGPEAFAELVRASHRLDLTDRRMLERQVNTLHQVASLVSARTLEYPVGVPDPDPLRTAVLSDLT